MAVVSTGALGCVLTCLGLEPVEGPVTVGMMICYDREFPESARSLMLAGAELVLTPNACGLDPLRIAQFQVRAYENAMAVAMANYPAPHQNGQSVAFDATGTPMARGGEDEGIVYAEFDLDALRAYRKATIWGAAWRRPDRYGALTGAPELEVFQRRDVFGHPHVP